MKLSDQAVAAIMMALQKCIMEETDITPILKSIDFQMDDKEQLQALNPPVFSADSYISPEIKETVGSD